MGNGENPGTHGINNFNSFLDVCSKLLTLKVAITVFISLSIALFPFIFKFFYTVYAYEALQGFLISIHNSWFPKLIDALIKTLYVLIPLVAFFVGYGNYDYGFISRIMRGIMTSLLTLALSFYIAMAIFSINISIHGNIVVGHKILSNLSYDSIMLISFILGMWGAVLIIGGRQTQIIVTLKSITLDLLTALLTTIISIIITFILVKEKDDILPYLILSAFLVSILIRFILEILVYNLSDSDAVMSRKHFVWGIMSSGLLSIILAITMATLITSNFKEVWFFDLVNLKFIGFEKVPYKIYGDSKIVDSLFSIDKSGAIHIMESRPFTALLIFISQIVLLWSVLADYIIEQLLWLSHKID